jgi:hypothetical protein
MIKHGTRLAAQTVFYSDQVEFYLVEFRYGKRADASVTFEEVPDGNLAAPTFRLTMEAAQEFFEQLWAQGFRSMHDRGSSDRLDAARAEHIADLRRAAKLENPNG